MKKEYDVEVECVICDTTFIVKNIDIDIELDEGYSDDDFWWIHIYRTDCPTCNDKAMVYVESDVPCCLD